jgi:hypothetical protein
MAVSYLDNGNVDGVVLGQSATAKIGFYGVTPVVQVALAATPAVSTSVPIAVCAGFGFQTSAQMIALLALVNAHRAALVTLGLSST